MRHSTSIFIIVAAIVALWASPALAQNQHPNATFMFGGDLFSSGQSDNIGPVAGQVLQDHWVAGDCPDGTGDDRYCDTLRFGMTLYPHADDGGACTVAYNQLHVPIEDGGGAIEKELQDIQNKAGDLYCSDPLNRPMEKSMYGLQSSSFVGTDAAADSPWDRPNLNLTVVGEFPQEPNGLGGYQTTVKKSIQAACDLLFGDDGTGNGAVPSIPTWVLAARQYDDDVLPFAGLASAAGGTAACCFDSTGTAATPTTCDPNGALNIDVCSHISGRSEGVLKANMLDGKYNCGPGTGYVQVGPMAYPEVNSPQGVQKAIQCHLVGRFNLSTNDQCSRDESLQDTDVLGKMACVRQIPRDFDPETEALIYCNDAGECTELTDCSDAADPNTCVPTIEWIDPNETLYVIVGLDGDGNKICDELGGGDGEIIVDPCPREGDACDVPGETGRCQPGTIQCVGTVEFCEPLFDPMPEICNGLDDDCEGRVDNLSDSWDNFPYSPTSLKNYTDGGIDRQAIHCYERDVCRYTGTGSFEHVGDTFAEFVTNWVPDIYVCSEGMSTDDPTAEPASAPASEGGACSATGSDAPVPTALLVMSLLAFAYVRRRS